MTQWVPNLASRLIGALTTGLADGGKRIGNALRSALDTAYMAGTGGTSQFSSIGTFVISGIIKGIQGAASSLWNTLRSVASNMLSTLKNALGIQSPSRVMREEVGRQIGAGIVGGMLDCREQVEAAAQTLAGGAVSGGRGGASALLGAAGTILRSTVTPISVARVQTPVSTAADSDGGTSRAAAVGGSTFIFQKPVETPYQHAQAIRETMEEMLYGT